MAAAQVAADNDAQGRMQDNEIEVVETVFEEVDELWENQRYYPILNWTDDLLPTDRCTNIHVTDLCDPW